jgi:hypothetical protein
MSGSFQFDSFLYRRDAEIMVECAVSYIPRSVHCLSEYLDYCLWMMAVWDLLPQPHSSMPYVQMGFMTATECLRKATESMVFLGYLGRNIRLI